MVCSFEGCQEQLHAQSFSVDYNEETLEIKESGGKKMSRISYFSDFILMQQLITLEIDIIIGVTENNIKFLSGFTKLSQKKENKVYRLNFGLEEKDLLASSNAYKIRLLEDQMDRFIKIFRTDDPPDTI